MSAVIGSSVSVDIKTQVEIAEYVWLDAEGNFRSKYRSLEKGLPEWSFDGSSTGFAETEDSEIKLVPTSTYCHINKGHIVVLCVCYDNSGKCLTPYYEEALSHHNRVSEEHAPWFAFEQEYFLMNVKNRKPLGYTNKSTQGKHYCGVGAEHVFGREIAEEHYRFCLDAGLKLSGINAEVAPGQWEFQVGPLVGIESANQCLLAKYLLCKIGEKHGVDVSFDPKPLRGDWNGSGMHTNYSTIAMRTSESAYQTILDAIERLSGTHKEHMALYGTNKHRLTGSHETSDPKKFSYGVGDRSASVRIPNHVAEDQMGYFEDRRPASDANPYAVVYKMLETTIPE